MSSATLLADIGGTNARFALSGPDPAAPLIEASIRTFAVADFGSLADAARHYLDEGGLDGDARPRHAVFAVAGRVDRDEARITNHPWVISAARTRQALGLDTLQLVNDFAAQAMAASLFSAADVVPIGGVGWSRPLAAGGDLNYAVIGPGTGLGVGALLRRDGRWYALQTEGGHVSFAPGTPEEIEILQRLSDEFGRVSNERLVSGAGLLNLHRALSAIAGIDAASPVAIPRQPPDITAQALQGDPRCLRVIDVFCAVFGAAAGDLVLTLGAWDGVFLTGGLVPKLMPWLARSGFRQRFEHKGRFAPTMARVPTLAVIHPQPGLLGAAALAQPRSPQS